MATPRQVEVVADLHRTFTDWVGFGEIVELLGSSGEDVVVEPLHFYVDRADDDLVVSVAEVTITRRKDAPEAARRSGRGRTGDVAIVAWRTGIPS